MEAKCIKMEQLEAKHDTFNRFKKVREIPSLYHDKTPHTIVESTGKRIIDVEEI